MNELQGETYIVGNGVSNIVTALCGDSRELDLRGDRLEGLETANHCVVHLDQTQCE